MRIRSIKPEFWRSDDIAALGYFDRLLFIALWSYVDDNGVGRDEEGLIIGDCFPMDMSRDPRDTLARIADGLRRLADACLIERYTVENRQYLHIKTWDQHQRIDRPNKPRYPLPTSGDAHPREDSARPSRHPREDSATGTEEQRNRGTEREGRLAIVAESPSVAKAPAPKRPPKGTRLPDDWEPETSAANLKLTEGHDKKWLSNQLDLFRDHWKSQSGQKAVHSDWNATWRNWLRRADSWSPDTSAPTATEEWWKQ